MRHAAASLVLSLALSGLPATAAAQRPGGGVSPAPLLDVPYVSQDERLCGGAAAAMLMRAAGARAVYAGDFAPLVDAGAGGIHTTDLAAALRARGYGVAVSNGTATAVQQQLSRRRPALALIEDRPGRYHYVVVVGWNTGTVVFHDPARAPFITRTESRFDSAWRATGRWMLTIEAPPADPGAPRDTGTPSGAGPQPSPERESATRRFLDRDYLDAARLAEHAVEANPHDDLSWRLLGASRYLSGDFAGALDAWNRAGDPTIDLVQVEGLGRTPHRAVERLVGLAPGTTLTRERLTRAQRRLALLPAQQASRVSYVALPGNLAEVRGAIVERPLYPSRIEWMATAARVPIDRELSLSVANAASAGDRLVATWRFWEGRPRAAIDFQFPSRLTGGVWRLSSEWQQEHYRDEPPTEVRDARLTWTNWSSARFRLSGAAGLARWTGRGTTTLVDAGVEFRPLSDRTAIEASTSSGIRPSSPFITTSIAGRWRYAPGTVTFFGSAAVVHASSRAPLDRWPGAGAGRARPLLLRAHPLLDDGRIDGPVFGRTVAQATVEGQRGVARRGLVSLGVATFTDVARGWQRADGTASPLHVDVGVGLRLRLAPGQPAIRLDLARGLRDGRMAVTAGWQMAWVTR